MCVSRPRAMAALLAACAMLTGCAVLCPAGGRTAAGTAGKTLQAYPACRWLKVMRQHAERRPDGRLKVTVEWDNTADEPYPVRVRAVFLKDDGSREEGAAWAELRFQPGGGNVMEFTSSTPEAARYRIEVQSASGSLW